MLRLAVLVPLLLTYAASGVAPTASAQPVAASAHAPTQAERAQGYAERDGQTVFVFDPSAYGLAPARVVVTGAFRAWSTDMDDSAWALTEAGEVWTLAVDAEAGPQPGTPFKFRVDDGRWLDPPAEAPNGQGGNLIFRFGETPPRLVAELRGPDAVWVLVEGADRPLNPGAYQIERWDGTPVRVEAVTPHEAQSALLTVRDLDPDHVHYVTVQVEDQRLRARARFDGLWRDLPSGSSLASRWWLGVHLNTPSYTTGDHVPGTWFRLFAPRADSVVLHLYESRTGQEVARRSLDPAWTDGLWQASVEEARPGTWYDYSVYGPDGPGSAFTNQTGQRVSDPYALVSDDSWGRGRVWQDRFETPQPVRGGRPAMQDVVAYEVHLQDFTDELPLADGVGPLEGFVTPGLTNSRGEAIGLDYLSRLGVNTVHLMPVQEFLHYPDADWQAAFSDDPFMQAQGVADENYQWGYRTTHAFAVESRFRSAGDEPGRERERFAALVDTLHARGMAVVIDVVFNHTGENMEGDERLLTFNGIDKWYYYRLDDDGNHIGAFGNEVKSENRPMTQRWLLDQLRHFVDVFGVDGFRIDLAGQTDEQTLRWLQAELGDDVLIYGEPWIASNDPDYEANPSWDWYKADSPITFFQDDARNAFKGAPSDHPAPSPVTRGFAGGDTEARQAALQGIANDYPEEPTPNAGINYLDIHDNWALADRFASCESGDCAWDGRAGVRDAEMRIAAALLLTSLGPVVMHGGTEIARSKGLAPLPEAIGGERILTAMPLAPIYIKGRGDTYNLRAANAFVWETVGQEGPVDTADMFDWWRGLIALRLSEAGEVFRAGGAVPDGWVRPILLADRPDVLGYVVGERVLVLVNVGDYAFTFSPGLDGTWRPVASSDSEGGRADPAGIGPAGALGVVRVPATGVGIWVRD